MNETNNSVLFQSIETLLNFTNQQNLTDTISKLEYCLRGAGTSQINGLIEQENIDKDMLKAAIIVKKNISQIDVVIHAVGIVNALRYILDEDEKVEYLSLGAGNTGKRFDVETDKRIAEFKFISWSGKSDTIRQNSTFKDFFELAEYTTSKRKCLYILDKRNVLKFFNNNRALDSVLSKNESTRKHFYDLYGKQFSTVSQYYDYKKLEVEIIDLNEVCPGVFED